MRLQVASDLHHERVTGRDELNGPLRPASGAELLVLAGDIHEGTGAIDLYRDYPIPVVYVHGNHEPMHHQYPALIDELRERAKGTSVRFLQADETVISGTRFLGACLWTDYELFPSRLAESLEHARRAVMECRLIRATDGRLFRPEDAIGHHRRTLLWLKGQLEVPFPGRTVVVTHHLPSARSIETKHREHILAPAYASDVEHLVTKADLWIHGHVHWSVDYQIGRCRVVCNPRGRPGRNRKHPEIPYENANFHPALIIDV